MDGVSPPQSSSSGLSPGMDGMLSKSSGIHPIGTGEHVPLLDNHSSNGGSPIHNGLSEDNSHDADSSLDGSLMDSGFSSVNDPEMPKLTAS